ncbi:MAG: thioredoxin family protein [Candidatus Omnitrophica bacterium]|nr:thioredoxin family protein [Candidatus Omnitrophota bacterium]
MLRKILILTAVLSLGLFSQAIYANVNNGETAPDFTLNDTNGAAHSLSQYKGKFVVLEWFNYDCPFVKKYYDKGNMQALQKEYKAKDVVWLAINSSAEGKEGYYPNDKLNELSKEKDMAATAVFIDSDGKVGKLYGAKTTPHMFVIDPQGLLIYQGAIDNKPSTDTADIASSVNYVKAALDEALAGKAVTEASTKSYGCSVKY